MFGRPVGFRRGVVLRLGLAKVKEVEEQKEQVGELYYYNPDVGRSGRRV
jgi:hypothetical protein